MEGLTSANVTEKQNIVEILMNATAGTGWMHESFNVQKPQKLHSWLVLLGRFSLWYVFFCQKALFMPCRFH
jgi:meiotically up-regulated gene 157 (Mug157) protein